MPELVQLVLERGVALPLLHRVHLELGDSGLHALDVFPQHRVLLLELSGLLPQLLELELPRLVVVQELLGEDGDVEAVAVLPVLGLGHAQLPVAVLEAVPLVPGLLDLQHGDNSGWGWGTRSGSGGFLFLLGFALSVRSSGRSWS